jgi:hypothetical protein
LDNFRIFTNSETGKKVPVMARVSFPSISSEFATQAIETFVKGVGDRIRPEELRRWTRCWIVDPEIVRYRARRAAR